MPLPAAIAIREVGPRDGLQPEAPLAVADRVRLISALVDAGLRSIEATAFVSPRAVPAMVGAGQVIAGLPDAPNVMWWALVPNVRGAELARAVGADHLTVTVSASEEYSRRNVSMGIDQSVAQAEVIAGMVPATDVVISCAFGSPYETVIDPGDVARIAARCRAAGTSVTLADTTGVATPRRVAALIDACGTDVSFHLHDTRGTALLNAYAAMERGVTRFDTAVGGLGGSPFATGAGGNLATEDLAYLCDDLGVATGINMPALRTASRLVSTLVGRPVPSRVAASLWPATG